MGKVSKIKVSKKEKHVALGDQIEQGKIASPSSRIKKKGNRAESNQVSIPNQNMSNLIYLDASSVAMNFSVKGWQRTQKPGCLVLW